jgi:hypothetical protein
LATTIPSSNAARRPVFLADQVGGDDDRDDDHQGRRNDHSWCGPMHLPQQKPQRRRGDRRYESADGEVEQHRTRVPALPGTDCGEDDDSEQSADRVDERPLPLQEGTDRPGRADEGQPREHDSRTRDNEDRADKERGAAVHAVVEQGDGRCDREAGEAGASDDETRHHLSHGGGISSRLSLSPASNRITPTAIETKGW